MDDLGGILPTIFGNLCISKIQISSDTSCSFQQHGLLIMNSWVEIFLGSETIPSRGLTYPTLGKGKSSSKCHFGGDMLVSWRVISRTNLHHDLHHEPPKSWNPKDFGHLQTNLFTIHYHKKTLKMSVLGPMATTTRSYRIFSKTSTHPQGCALGHWLCYYERKPVWDIDYSYSYRTYRLGDTSRQNHCIPYYTWNPLRHNKHN